MDHLNAWGGCGGDSLMSGTAANLIENLEAVPEIRTVFAGHRH